MWQPVSFRAEDRELVQIAIDECRRLGLGKYSPTGIVWREKMSPDRCKLSHNYLHLPQALNGRLQLVEWRPLIASAVLQRFFVKRKQRPRNVVRRFLIVYAFAIGAILTAVVVPQIQSLRIAPVPEPVKSAIGWMIMALSFLGAGLVRLSNGRDQRLWADTQEANQDGRENLLQTLMRIGSFGFEANPSKIRTLFSSWPTLSQRIRNLEKAQPALPAKTKADQFEAFRKYWGQKP